MSASPTRPAALAKTRGAALAAERGMEYLPSARLPEALPRDGRVLVHNNVVGQIAPDRRPETRGFRAWLQRPDATLEQCHCGWAAKLGPHYRKRRLDLVGDPAA